METINEEKKCYASIFQRELLIEFSKNEFIRENFFLTGGTCLSVFYLHHRISDDLDFFSYDEKDLSIIENWVKNIFYNDAVKISSSNYFLSQLVKGIKIDFVIDHHSNKKKRMKYYFNGDDYIYIDNLKNIVSNKLCTLVSRSEPKDFLDFYFVNNIFKFSLEEIYQDAKLKDGIFEDVPTVAYQIESNLKFMLKNRNIFPKVLLNFNEEDFKEHYKNLIIRISRLTTL